MKKYFKIGVLLLLMCLLLSSNTPINHPNLALNADIEYLDEVQYFQEVIDAKHPKREFRAAWVTTFSNLDWPSNNRLSTAKQQEEFIELLAHFKRSNINAVIVQVRAAGDAFYPSKLAPWSAWLTGTQGKAPEPYYDPLAFMIEECRKQNMEFHAWFNPYRAVSHTKFSSVAPYHISKVHPDWFFTYGETVYFNPGLPEVKNHILKIIAEVVNNYDIDGIHLDDYFYPYTIKGLEIPDFETYQTQKTSTEETIFDWRRNNVNDLVKRMGDTIKTLKPHVKFGISPYAVWRNKKQDPLGSETLSGQTSFDNLYCDTKKWMEQEWLDYIAPQLYWSIKSPYTSYTHLIDWWAGHPNKRHLYIGHAIYKLNKLDKHSFETAELVDQIYIARSKPSIQGNIYFRADAFKKNYQNFIEIFNEGMYKYPALIPKMSWIDDIPPLAPQNLKKQVKLDDFITFTWEQAKTGNPQDTAHYYVVYITNFKPESLQQLKAEHIAAIQQSTSFTRIINRKHKNYLTVTAVDRLHNESNTLVSTLL